jgi:TPR repeat protein
MKHALLLGFLLIGFLLVCLPLSSQVPSTRAFRPSKRNDSSSGYSVIGRNAMIDWRSLRGDKNYARAVSLYRAGEYVKAAVAYERACSESFAAACTDLGFMYRHGQGVRRNYVCAAKLYRRGCDGGNALGCANLGLNYWNGVFPKDDDRAKELFRQACVKGDEGGCVVLSFMHEKSYGVTPDKDQASDPSGQPSGPERQDQIPLTLHEACRF